MLKPPVSDTSRSQESWAEVRAHDTVMRYRRSGAGRSILVLRSSDATSPWPELLDGLRRGYRLIDPEPPAGDADVAAWLGGFLEGLGTSTVRIVADDRFCIPVLELALRESDQITRMVLVAAGPSMPDAARGVLETAMGHAPVPLLVLRGGHAADDVISLITDFLGEESAGPA